MKITYDTTFAMLAESVRDLHYQIGPVALKFRVEQPQCLCTVTVSGTEEALVDYVRRNGIEPRLYGVFFVGF